MVFIGGPRQVGKTTIAKGLVEDEPTATEYFNWDNEHDRKAIRANNWRGDSKLIVFDELHKMPAWKRWIKGIYDTKPLHQQLLVTGSARLDVYKKGGDSLLGRYHYWRLHPLTLDELPRGISKTEGFSRLLKMGGFPEPFLRNDERRANRWRRERFDRVLREDIRDLERIRDIQLLQLFVESLRTRVGGIVTLSNIAGDLEISPTTAKTWLSLIENMYLGFAVYPMTTKIKRSILKPPKVYFFDNADVDGDEGACLENLVATGICKRLHFIEDYYGHRCSLHYIRDKDKREVDFAVVINNKLEELIEVKQSDSQISSSLSYYANKLKPKRAIQLVSTLRRAFDKDGVRVMHPTDYFVDPPWTEAKTSYI